MANIGLPVVLGVYFVLIFAFPPSRSDYSGSAETITINRWWETLGWATVATIVVAFVVGLVGKRKRAYLWWLPFSISIVSPFLCCGGFFNAMISHADMASVKDRDGAEYHLLGQSFLQGSELVIGRLQKRVGFIDRFEVIAHSPWEGDYLEVVRPKERVREEPELWLTKDRILVGLPYKNDAYVAYDLKTNRPYSETKYSNRGNSDIRSLSPFLLLKSGDVPSESDYNEMLDPESEGYPDKFALELDLYYQKDPLQVSLARKLLPVLQKNPPKR